MKIFTGFVTSKNMQKTATVSVNRVIVHPVYKKRVRLTKKYQVHDELGTEVGQEVRFTASKPFSKTKKWNIVGVVKRETGKAKSTEKPATKERKTKK